LYEHANMYYVKKTSNVDLYCAILYVLASLFT